MTQEELEKKELEKQQKKLENKRNAANNAQALRIAAQVAEKSPDPYVGGAGKIISTADKITLGKSTEMLGHIMNQGSRYDPLKKATQGIINKTVESGGAQIAGKVASAQMDKNIANANNMPKKTEKNVPQQKKEQIDKKQSTNDVSPKNNQDKKQGSATINQQTTQKKESTDIEKTSMLPILLPIIGLILLPLIFIMIIPILAIVPINAVLEAQQNDLGKFSTITVMNTENHIYDGEVSFEDYIAGMLAAKEYPIENLEFYKYQAIYNRTNFVLTNSSNVVDGSLEPTKYIDVEDSPHKDTINKAIEETKGMFITQDEIINLGISSIIVKKEDHNYYYLEYAKNDEENTTNSIKISKNWNYINFYQKYLDNNTDRIKLNEIIALYLITYENYDYEKVIKFYNEKSTIKNFNIGITGQEVNGFITPLQNFSCSNGYGCRLHPVHNYYRIHTGVDMGASSGENIYATKSGEITHVTSDVPGYSTSQSYGNYITIKHDDGSQTRYAHLLFGSIPSYIYVGARVNQGQIIGQVGSTGTSTGPHLHYEIFIAGERVNPYYYMDLTNASNDAKYCNSNENVSMSLCGY